MTIPNDLIISFLDSVCIPVDNDFLFNLTIEIYITKNSTFCNPVTAGICQSSENGQSNRKPLIPNR